MSTRRRGYRHVKSNDTGNRIRVRGKRHGQGDETKLTLAYWQMAKELVADKTNPRLPTEAEVTARAQDVSDEEVAAYRRKLAS